MGTLTTLTLPSGPRIVSETAPSSSRALAARCLEGRPRAPEDAAVGSLPVRDAAAFGVQRDPAVLGRAAREDLPALAVQQVARLVLGLLFKQGVLLLCQLPGEDDHRGRPKDEQYEGEDASVPERQAAAHPVQHHGAGLGSKV